MLKIRNETKIGILAVAAIALGVIGFKYLQGINVLKTSRNFYVRYDQVDQLRPSAPVFINGLEVGMVKTLKLDPADNRTIIAEINIERGVDVPKDAVATIIGLSLMGGKAIRLDNTYPCGDNCAESGDWLKGDSKSFLETVVGDPKELDAYTARITHALGAGYDSLTNPNNPQGFGRTLLSLEYSMKNIEVMTHKINRLIDASTSNLSATAANAAEITRIFRNNGDNISSILNDLTAVSKQLKGANLDETSRKAAIAIDSLTTALGTLRQTLRTTGHALSHVDSLAARLAHGDGTAGKLLTDEELYTNLVRTTRQMQLLAQDIRLNPKRYNTVKLKIFGKNNTKEYSLPIDDPAYQIILDSLEDEYSKKAKG